MSRVGKIPVAIPTGVEVQISGDTISAKGSKGSLKLTFEPKFVSAEKQEGAIVVSRKGDSPAMKARHGLYRNLINNLVQGVSEGFSKTLEIKGVGYRAAMKGKNLELALGFSHLVNHPIPEGIEIKFQEKSQNILTISGIDKQLVGQVAADIRSYRKPEPYKGKGIKYSDEVIVRKAGKSVAKKG